jgi:hypothetical protein
MVLKDMAEHMGQEKPKKIKSPSNQGFKDSLKAVIKDLQRCAKQNEMDGKPRWGWSCYDDSFRASAVASEQRRMIKILKGMVLKAMTGYLQSARRPFQR